MSQFNSVINLLTKHLQFNHLLAAYLLESMNIGYIICVSSSGKALIYICVFVVGTPSEIICTNQNNSIIFYQQIIPKSTSIGIVIERMNYVLVILFVCVSLSQG